MKICILVDIETNKQGKTFVRLYHNEESNKLVGARITIRGKNLNGEKNGGAQEKLAHEMGHVIAELFEKQPIGLKNEIAAWEWAVKTGVKIQNWTMRKSLSDYIQTKEDIETIESYAKD